RLKLIAKVEGKEAVFHGRIVDVSELGLGAVISGSLEQGDQVLLEFKGATGDVTFRLRATTRSARGFRHGFQFFELSPPDVQELRRACFGLAETLT
ncbi:MAG: PilZ domain-containing protein, partial [Candidatus Angelobacter sp.]